MAAQALTLYNHVEHLLILLEDLENAARPEDREAILEALAAETDGTEAKTDRNAHVLAMLHHTADNCTAEVERINKLKASVLRQAKNLEASTLDAMMLAGTRKFTGKTNVLCLRTNQPSVDVRDEEALPAEFIDVFEERTPMKSAIKKAIEAATARWFEENQLGPLAKSATQKLASAAKDGIFVNDPSFFLTEDEYAAYCELAMAKELFVPGARLAYSIRLERR